MAKQVNSARPRSREIRAAAAAKKRRAPRKSAPALVDGKISVDDHRASNAAGSNTFAIGTVIDPRWARLF